GKGGMGTVWLCRDETLQRNVAVKQVGLLPGESVTDSARAFREARSTAALSHRNVVTVFDVVEDSGHIWLVMEHVPGRSLSQIIKQDGPLDPGTVAEIGAQVAAGLAAAHAAGTMHRDVKPGNVLIREDGVAKISDFGIARTHGDPALTQSGFLTGTPSYFSPELARGGDPGPGTDVWALGAALYAAVEGHPPYEQRTNPVAVLHDITQGQPPHPQRADFLEPALQRMMDRDPKSRWSMDDAAHVLRRLADQHKPESTLVNTMSGAASAPPREVASEEPSQSATATAPRPSPTPVDSPPRSSAAPVQSVAGPTKRPRRRGPAQFVLAAVALLLVLGGVAWYVSQLRDGEQQAGDTAAQNDDTAEQGNDEASSSSSSPEEDEPSETAPASPAEEKEEFVRSYYEKAPGGTDEAWAMLGPSLKEQGRASYDGFWQDIESVEVQSAEANGNTVDVTLVYSRTNGETSTERKQEGLISDGEGGYLLDTDTMAQ
ncbi:MAG TPA: serine/threonine-protein kinase, partial [Microlunatus sp.]|nr:serine/threonine-protein kinase [Microlunatus sp.]